MAEVYRHLPFDVTVEQALLGACLIDNAHIEIAAETITPGDFYDPLHERMFETMLELKREFEVRVTPLVLHASMKADPGLIQVKGLAYLAGIAEASPSLPSVRDYARIIADLKVRRELIQAGEDFINAAFAQPLELPTAKVLAQAEGALQSIHMRHAAVLHSRRPRPAGEVAHEAAKDVEDRMNGKSGGLISTGFHKLDNALGGYAGSDLIIVAGRPGMGKSAFMGCTSLSVARQGRPVLVFTNEMRAKQWTDRNICDLDFDMRQIGLEAPLHYQRFRRGTLSAREFERMVLAGQRLAEFDYEVCDDESLTVEDIESRARAWKRKRIGEPQGIVIVDYLQRIRESDLGRGATRAAHVGHMARGLKSLAKELDIPVIAASSNNRDSENRNESDRKPRLKDLRESGDIESEADIVMGPYRKAYYVGKERPEAGESDPEWPVWQSLYRQWKNVMDICIMKHRHGEADIEVRLWADMAASAIRDDEHTAQSQAQADLSLGLP